MTLDIFVLLSDSERFLRFCSISAPQVMPDNYPVRRINYLPQQFYAIVFDL